MTKQEIIEFVNANPNKHVIITLCGKEVDAFSYLGKNNYPYFFQNERCGSTPDGFSQIQQKYNLKFKYSWILDYKVTDIKLINNNDNIWWW